MAINFTVSYTFTPSSTISSSQMNTNFSDEASVWQGLEALTKTFAKLKVDVDPTTALEVATKQYVDHYSTWRRPVLQFASITTVAVESGLDGTSGDIPMLFPDGTVRTETSATRTTFDITRNCVLSGTAQSGLRATLSEAVNTWLALYAVKVTDSSTTWVTVGDTRLPIQANFSALNTAFGTSGWVYLGLVRNGDNAGTTGDLLDFQQSGNVTTFKNLIVGGNTNDGNSAYGTRLAGSGAAGSLTYSYSAGTGTTNVPNNISQGIYTCHASNINSTISILNSTTTRTHIRQHDNNSSSVKMVGPIAIADGLNITPGTGTPGQDIFLAGFVDGVLGVGSMPLL